MRTFLPKGKYQALLLLIVILGAGLTFPAAAVLGILLWYVSKLSWYLLRLVLRAHLKFIEPSYD